MKEPIRLDPWTQGINNTSPLRGSVYQPGEKGAALRDAVNVDLDRSGSVTRRDGYTKVADLVDGHSGTSVGGGMYLVSDGSLYRYDAVVGELLEIAAGVGSEPVSYTEVGNSVYWSNINARGAIHSGASSFWGIEIGEIPLLSNTTGDLRAGRYMVALTHIRDGAESGSRGAAVVVVADGSGIDVTPIGVPSGVEEIGVYCTDADGADLYWVFDAAVGDPIKISAVEVSVEVLDSVGLHPPPLGSLVFHFNGRMFVCTDDGFYWSQPLEYHRFHISADFQATRARPVVAAALADGFYLALENGETLWVSGNDPETWHPEVVDTIPAMRSSALYLPARKFPWLQLPADTTIAVWSSVDGIAVGLPGGVVMHPMDGRVALDKHDSATLLYREKAGLRQIIIGLRNKTDNNVFGVGDLATASVIKAGLMPE